MKRAREPDPFWDHPLAGPPMPRPRKRARAARCAVCVRRLKGAPTVCPRADCGYRTCRTCVVRYLQTRATTDVHCMACRHVWEVEVAEAHGLVRALRPHHERVLLAADRAHLADAQLQLAHQQRLRDLQAEFQACQARADALRRQLAHARRQGPDDPRTPATKCPLDGCRGFLARSRDVDEATVVPCATCRRRVCRDCLTAADAAHVCRADIRATAQLVAATTKPCPQCHTRIGKTDGCDQMWCTACHTAWDWASGRKVLGPVHNPHYFASLRAHGAALPRQPGDVRCGGLPAALPADHDSFDPVLRLVLHVAARRLPPVATEPDPTALRVRFLRGEVDEARYAAALYGRHQRRLKRTRYRQRHEAFVAAAGDLFRRLLDGHADAAQLHAEFHALRHAYNAALAQLHVDHKDRAGRLFEFVTERWEVATAAQAARLPGAGFV